MDSPTGSDFTILGNPLYVSLSSDLVAANIDYHSLFLVNSLSSFNWPPSKLSLIGKTLMP